MGKGHLLIATFLILFGFFGCQDQAPRGKVYDFRISKISLPETTSLRGLSVVSDSTWWISGSQGTAAFIQYNYGKVDSKPLVGYAHKDFRDIHGWNNQEAIILSVGDSTLILKSKNQWKQVDTVFTDYSEGVFVDAFDFEGENGIAYGDAIDGILYVLESSDRGSRWSKIPAENLPSALGTEGGFAASGTNVDIIHGSIYIATGAGIYPRLISGMVGQSDWEATPLPLQRGPTQGAYSIVFKNTMEGVVIGGSFQDSTRADSVCAYTQDGGKNWTLLENGVVPGFRSCVAYSEVLDIYLAVGRTGIDYSYNGSEWIAISSEGGYYACSFGKKSAILVGRGGKCAKIEFTKIKS